MSIFIHVDFNSFFATIEQQANPRLRGKAIGVSGGDRLTRTVIGAASVEAKLRGVRTGMRVPEALKLCPDLILVRGDSDKYLEVTKRFLNILKDYSPYLEVFSIDEVFIELRVPRGVRVSQVSRGLLARGTRDTCEPRDTFTLATEIAQEIKQRIKQEIGQWVRCSVGISYNKMLAKLAGSLYKPDGLVVIEDREAAQFILDRRELDDVCGIGFRTRAHLNNMGIFTFADLRKVELPYLLASFKSYGKVLYDFARGEDHRAIVPFYEKEEVKSVGHRHTISHDVSESEEIKQYLLKLSEMVARRLRAKKLEGRTVSFWYRAAFNLASHLEGGGSNFGFEGGGMQSTVLYTNDGLEIFKVGWKSFQKIWLKEPIRMVGISVSNLRATTPQNLSFLEEVKRREVITKALDKINDRYGEFTLCRGVLLGTYKMKRMPNPFLSDRRFKI